jgi:hypothetical protein
MSTFLFLIAIGCSYYMGYLKNRGEYRELRNDFRTLVYEDEQVISDYRKHIRHLESEIARLERLANG